MNDVTPIFEECPSESFAQEQQSFFRSWLKDQNETEKQQKYPSPEVSLWQAVIIKAFEDAAINYDRERERHHREAALLWLLKDNLDFILICEWASLDPGFIREKALQAALYGLEQDYQQWIQ